MQVVALIPAVLALFMCLLRSPARAFTDVYLPVLLLLPNNLKFFVGGLPDLGFQHAAIFPIAIFVLLRPGAWRPCFADVLVLTHVLTMGLSQYRGTNDLNSAQNVVFDQTVRIFLPYLLARLLIEREGLRTVIGHRFVLCLAIVALLSLWQFRMGKDIFFGRLWTDFFPGQSVPRSTYRMGFMRITGPYEHAILAGVVMSVGVFIATWLHGTKRWSTRNKGLLMLAGVCAGSLMTLSRGPWMGILLGGGIAFIGYARRRGKTFLRATVLGLGVGIPATLSLIEYASVGRSTAETRMQENVAYRMELLDVYMPTIMEKPFFGWGLWRWEADSRFESVDNHYLLLALNHGLVGLGLFVLIIFWVGLRLVAIGARAPPRTQTSALAFTLLGAIICVAFSVATVWLGAQTAPVLFLILGWSEGLIQARPRAYWRQTATTTVPTGLLRGTMA